MSFYGRQYMNPPRGGLTRGFPQSSIVNPTLQARIPAPNAVQVAHAARPPRAPLSEVNGLRGFQNSILPMAQALAPTPFAALQSAFLSARGANPPQRIQPIRPRPQARGPAMAGAFLAPRGGGSWHSPSMTGRMRPGGMAGGVGGGGG